MEDFYDRTGGCGFSEKVINDLIQEYLEKDISTIKFRKIIYDEVNRIEDIVIDQEIHPYVQNLYTQAVRNILIYLQDNYGLKYSGVMEMVFVKMLYVLNNQNKHTDDRKYEHLAKQLQRVMYRYYKMGLIFYEMLHQAVDYETNPWFVRMFAMLYFTVLQGMRWIIQMRSSYHMDQRRHLVLQVLSIRYLKLIYLKLLIWNMIRQRKM